MNTLKKIKYSYKAEQKHWVGDGFHVYGLLRPTDELNKFISPFVMLDYASPKEFSSSSQRRGVGEHPHRGIETVTIAYQGEVEHRDSSGGGGVIKSGDVQWMTAGSGLVHDEFHSVEFSKKGGILLGPAYKKIFQDFVPQTTTEVSKLLKSWEKSGVLKNLLLFKF